MSSLGSRILYTSGYKYQLARPYELQLSLVPACAVLPYLVVTADGLLRIAGGYAWDGPSGPTIDTRNFMRASLVHDALYQLMREGRLDKRYRKHADDLLYTMCREDGMSWLRAQWVYGAVRAFAGWAADPAKTRILSAPY